MKHAFARQEAFFSIQLKNLLAVVADIYIYIYIYMKSKGGRYLVTPQQFPDCHPRWRPS